MTSLINVKELYNDIATATGFPQYSNTTDTPDITRFMFEMITEGLNSTLDLLSTNSATGERVDVFATIPGQDRYNVAGMVKHLEVKDPTTGRYNRVFYSDTADTMAATNEDEIKRGFPRAYVISGGSIKLFPVPDDIYEMRTVLYSNHIILADDDTYKNKVTSINDVIIGTADFEQLIKLRIIALILIRCASSQAQIYSSLAQERIKTYIEKASGSNEPNRNLRRSGGHYDVRRGLLG